MPSHEICGFKPELVASRIAHTAHAGQVDKGGQDYIGHPARIAGAVAEAGYDGEVEAVAWLHDVVEDTDITIEYLRSWGFSEEVLDAVDAITQRQRETAPAYYARVLTSRLAHVVKWYDVADNASPERMSLLALDTQERLKAKYVRAREVLGGPPPPYRFS